MKKPYAMIGAALVMASAVSVMAPVPAHATGGRSNAMRRCVFRSHAWGVVQGTSDMTNIAGLDTHAEQQTAVAHLQERYFRIESRFGSPYWSQALLNDLTSAWIALESVGYDNDQYDAALGTDLNQAGYWSNQGASDTAQAWAAIR